MTADRRIALFSHDSQGLGHVRRNIELAAALVHHSPGTEVLLISGAPAARTLPLPPRTRLTRIPAVAKDRHGGYSAAEPGRRLDEVLATRSLMTRVAVEGFSPDLLVVDRHARGIGGELDEMLRAVASARRRGSGPRTVLGLRDVLDEPIATAHEWRRDRVAQTVREHYDEVWIYGDPRVFDPATTYRWGSEVAARVRYTGYLSHHRGLGLDLNRSLPDALPVAGRRHVLGLVGGGQDGAELARAFAAAEFPAGHLGILVTGPYLDAQQRWQLERLAAAREDLQLLSFVPSTLPLLHQARAVVTMGGYNTICEVLATGAPALVVPRVRPRREQALRAELLSRCTHLEHLPAEQATPERLGTWLAAAVARPPRRHRIDLDGLTRVSSMADSLLAAATRQRVASRQHSVPRPRTAGPCAPRPPIHTASRTEPAMSQTDCRAVDAIAERPPSQPRVGYLLKMYPRFSETFVLTEMLSIERAGADLHVFSMRYPTDGRFHESLAELRAPVSYLPAKLRSSELWQLLATRRRELGGLARHLDLLLDAEPDEAAAAVELAVHARRLGLTHLHAHFASTATTVARIAAALAGIGYSFTAHAKDIFHEDVDRDALARKLREAAFAVTVSEHNLGYLRDTFGDDAGKVVRLYNGVDLTRFQRSFAARQPRIAAVGRLVEKKGFADLLDAVAHLRATGRSVPLEIAGTGPEEEALRRRCTDLGLDDLITFHGALPQQDVRRLVASSAIFAAPCVVGADGNRDGLPTVLLEAQALGTPVVSTPVTGIPEAVVDGETGLLVPPGDSRALAAAMARLLDDPGLAVTLADGARTRIEEFFDTDRNSRQLLRRFSEVSRRHSTAAPAVTPTAASTVTPPVAPTAGPSAAIRVPGTSRQSGRGTIRRIAYVCTDPGIGVFGRKGASIHVQSVLRVLVRRGVQVHLICAATGGGVPDGLRAVQVHRLPEIPDVGPAERERHAQASDRAVAAELDRLHAEAGLDLVYERYALWGRTATTWARTAGVPSVLEVNAPLVTEQRQHRVLIDEAAAWSVAEQALGSADAAVCVSDTVAGWAAARAGSRTRVAVVPNGVDIQRFTPAQGQVRDPGQPGFTVGFVGTLKTWHGVEILLEAMARLLQRDPGGYRCLIVGDGPRAAELDRLAHEFAIEAAVERTGAVWPGDVPKLITRMDVAVAPYPPTPDFYFSPLKIYEYLAAGVPVVASRIGPIPELLGHGRWGALVEPGSPDALADAIAALRAAPEHRQVIRDQGPQAARSHDWAHTVAKTLALVGLELPELAHAR